MDLGKGQILRQIKQRYTSALIAGDGAVAERSIDQGVEKGIPVIDLYLQVLIPAQGEVRRLFDSGEMSLTLQQLATSVTLREMEKLRRSMTRVTPLKRAVTVWTAEGDIHEVDARMVADFLYTDGWEVEFVGADSSNDELLTHLRKRAPDLVALSINLESSVEKARETLSVVRKEFPALHIMIVGDLAKDSTIEQSGFNVDAIARDAAHAMEEARRATGLSPVGPTLEQYLQMLGNRIHLRRRLLSMSQQQLADTAGMDRAYISLVERGKQNVSIGAVMKLSTALRVPLTELLGQGDSELFPEQGEVRQPQVANA